MGAVPKRPEPADWLRAAADELRRGDAATLKLLQQTYRDINKILKGLPDGEGAAFGMLIQRAQMERVRRDLLSEQAKLFDRLGDTVAARRLRSATRAAKLSRAADDAYLSLAGEGAEGKRLYDGADITSQRTVEAILARVNLSKVPLAERIYNTKVWMNGRLDRLIATTMASGLNAKRFAKVARDWFAPSVPGGTRYAAMRLARTEINNAFHATTIDYAASKPWVSQMEWHLSKSHSKPDKCNEYADLSPWDVTAIPRKPHPQCMCYVVEKSMDEDEWIDRFANGEFDDYLDGELAKADGHVPAETGKTATGGTVTVLKGKASEPKAAPIPELTGEAAMEIVPKGLTKRGTMTPKQRKEAKVWETGWFAVINGFLRRREGEEEQDDSVQRELRRTIETLDSAYAESPLSQPIQTWRGMHAAQRLFGDRLDGDLTGFSWSELGYVSTTYKEKIADLFMISKEQNDDEFYRGKNVKVIVHVDAGVQALVISTETRGGDSSGPQAEIAIQRGTKWTVVKDHGKHPTSDYRLVEVRVSLA